MSKYAIQFLQMAASGVPTAAEPAPAEPKPEVSLKLCQGDCLEHTAHIRRQGYWECSLCQNRIYATDTTRSNSG
jgi:hypothetical protein